MSRRGTGGEPQQGNGRGSWRDGNWRHAERPHFHAQQPETGGRGWTQCPPEGSQFPPLEYQDQGRGGKRPQYPQQPGRGGRGWHQRQQGWGRGGERSQVPYHPEIIEQNWPQRILERPPYPPRQHQQQGRGSGGEGRGLGSFQGGGFAYSQLPRAPPQHQQQGQGSGGDGRHCDHPQSRRDWGHGSVPNYCYSPQPHAPPQHQQQGQGSGDDGCRCDHPHPRRDWGHGSGPNYGYSPQPRAPPQNQHQGQGSGGDGRSCDHPQPQHDWGHGSGPNYGCSPQPCGPPHHHQQGLGSGGDGRHCDNPQRHCDWGHGSGPNYNYRVGGYRDNPQPRGAPQYQQGQGRGGEGRGSDHNQPQRGRELGSRPHYQGGGSSDSPHPHGPPQGQGGQSSGYQSHHGRSPQPRGGAYGERNKGKAREASYSSPGPPSPELHQTTEAPHVSSEASSSAQLSSSSSRALGISAVTQQLQQLSVQSETGAVKASTGKKHCFADRPNIGSAGRKCIVRANHFVAEIAKKEIFQYDVCITPEVNHSKLNREIMEALVTRYRETHLGGCRPAYDGSKCLYTAGELPFPSKEFQITLPQRPTAPYSVVIRVTSTGERINLDHIAEFLNGLRKEVPQDALQVLDIVLKGSPTSRYTTVGRSFFSPVLGRRQNLGGGIESWRGFYQSIRPTQMGLSLNVDISATAVIQPLPVIDFLTVYLGHLRNPRDQGVNLWHPLRDADFVKVKMVLYGLKVEVTHRGDIRRKSRIYDLTREPTRDVTFQAGDATKSVVDFFWETYGIRIQYLNLPCLKVGNEKRPNYLPMEVCRLVEKQRFTKKLTENQIKTLLAYTCQRPQDRESLIGQMVDHNDYNEDIYCQEFGLTVNRNLTTVNARILKSPELKYHDSGNQKVICPQDGRWNMHNKKLLNGGRVRNWICIYFPQQQRIANRRENAAHQDNAQNAVREFCHGLAHMCVEMGMGFSLEPVLPHKSVLCDQLEQGLRALYHDAMNILRPHGEELDLLVAILPNNNSSLYGHLKKICETDLGIVSQCCLTNNILQMKPEYLSNVALKINVKVGGRNTVLVNALSMKVPGISDVPTIIFGADVTHPRPGEDSACSISAVVASQDWPHLTKYAGLVNAQRHREEIIEDLYKEWQHPQRGTVAGGMIRELLISFRGATNVKPERIIYYRDGVSDGQFHQVLLCELDAIRKACFSLEPNYQPRVTFVVVQKRHHTRLFLDNYNTRHRREHISPGTVVDSKICHPNEFDFYLCSHAGIRGTSRPAHYYVLWDENKFSADNIQTLTNDLCYTYVRCTRSVSIVPPVYYAHLAAFRARFYIEPEIGSAEDQSVREGEGGQQLQSATRIPGPVKPLPALKEKVKRVMFYC